MRVSPGKKLTYKNNWENDEYYVEGKPVVELKTVSIRGKVYKVTSKDVYVPVQDMGHTYNTRSTHYFIEEAVFGRKRKFDLNEIVPNQPVFAVSYKVQETLKIEDTFWRHSP